VYAISNVSKKLLERLKRKTYRQAYLAEHTRRGIAYQIRALRDQRGWKQGFFAKLLRKPQSVISRLEDPSYGKVTIQTLLEVANVFDVALQVRFVSYSSFLLPTRNVSVASMQVPEFKDDWGLRSGPIKTTTTSPGEITNSGRDLIDILHYAQSRPHGQYVGRMGGDASGISQTATLNSLVDVSQSEDLISKTVVPDQSLFRLIVEQQGSVGLSNTNIH
jgi:transcriptional regulator with XRE-family HTH domain